MSKARRQEVYKLSESNKKERPFTFQQYNGASEATMDHINQSHLLLWNSSCEFAIHESETRFILL